MPTVPVGSVSTVGPLLSSQYYQIHLVQALLSMKYGGVGVLVSFGGVEGYVSRSPHAANLPSAR